MNNNKNLISLVSNAIFNEKTADFVIDVAEVSIDSLLTTATGISKEIPVIKGIIAVLNARNIIHNRNLVIQLLNFIDEFHKGTILPHKLTAYKNKLKYNPKYAEKEVERIVLILDRNIDTIKSRLLAKAYKSYFNEDIDWDCFIEYTEIIRRLFVSDISNIDKILNEEKTPWKSGRERLESLGLIQMKFEASEKMQKIAYGIEKEGKGISGEVDIQYQKTLKILESSILYADFKLTMFGSIFYLATIK